MSVFQRILVAVDGSGPANAGLALALRLAREASCRLVVCHAIDLGRDYRDAAGGAQMIGGAEDLIAEDRTESRKLLDAAVAAAAAAGVEATGELLEGRPGDAVVQRARDGGFDLIVTGTHGRRGLEHLLFGSTAETIVRLASIPVLTVRA